MAARRETRADRPWRFYVYALVDGGEIVYIGKGSGKRLSRQKSDKKLSGHEIARFWKEQHAYEFEMEAIAEHRPALNKHPGGNGPIRTAWRGHRLSAAENAQIAEMDRLGTRRYVARYLLGLDWKFEKSKIDTLRQVAYG